MYDTVEELLREIQAGEDSFLDFKEVLFQGHQIKFIPSRGQASQELAKDLSCFANTEGGVLLFGVRRDGERVGMSAEAADALQEFILNVAQNNVEPPLGHLLLFDRVMIPDRTAQLKLCLKLEVRKALYAVHAPRGDRPYHRLVDQCLPMTLEQQARLFERRGMMQPFEERPVISAPADAIERSRFEEYYRLTYGGELGTSRLPYEQLLQNLKLLTTDEAGTMHPTVVGLLLFCGHPERYLSGAYVDVAAYEDVRPDASQQSDAKPIYGTILEQVERVLSYLKSSPMVPIQAEKDGVGRLDKPAYSARALQEAVVNALVHRDYSISGSQIRVFLFRDRIEISNPGRLHNTLTVESLYAGCQPVRRNQLLAGFLRTYVSPLTGRAYMEGRGEGFLAMVRECEAVSGRPPEMQLVGDSVRLTIHRAGHPASPEETEG
jgi:predicted HTH transcriptional regulator